MCEYATKSIIIDRGDFFEGKVIPVNKETGLTPQIYNVSSQDRVELEQKIDQCKYEIETYGLKYEDMLNDPYVKSEKLPHSSVETGNVIQKEITVETFCHSRPGRVDIKNAPWYVKNAYLNSLFNGIRAGVDLNDTGHNLFFSEKKEVWHVQPVKCAKEEKKEINKEAYKKWRQEAEEE